MSEKLQNWEKSYYRALHRLVDEIYEEASKSVSWKGLADKAGVSYITVCNLGNRKTRFPVFRTVFLLARAVGWEIELSKNKKIKVRKVAA